MPHDLRSASSKSNDPRCPKCRHMVDTPMHELGCEPTERRLSGEDVHSNMAQAAPEIIMAANGIYWRRYEDSLSMVPTSDDNDPVLTPYAVYRLVGYEDHEGTFNPVNDRVSMGTLAKVATVAEQMRRRAESAEADRDRYRQVLKLLSGRSWLDNPDDPNDPICSLCGFGQLVHEDDGCEGPCTRCPEQP